MGGAASGVSPGISDMSLRMGTVGGRVCIGLGSGAAAAFEVGEVDPMRETVSCATGVALSPDRIVPPNCEEGITGLGLENCEVIALD